MYKDKEKQKEANRKASQKYREKGMTEGMTVEGAGYDGFLNKNKALRDAGMTATDLTKSYPDILNKLTDPVWRSKLEKICHAFQESHHPDYARDVLLNGIDLETIGDLLEVTG